MDYKFWLSLSTNLLGLWFAYKQLQSARPRQEKPMKLGYQGWTKSNWRIGVMVLLVILCWVPYFLSGTHGSLNRDAKIKTVSGKVFRNEVVLLDGTDFENCEFDSVTFKYNGTTPINFNHNAVKGFFLISSDREDIETAMVFSGIWSRDVTVFGPDGKPSRQFLPPKRN